MRVDRKVDGHAARDHDDDVAAMPHRWRQRFAVRNAARARAYDTYSRVRRLYFLFEHTAGFCVRSSSKIRFFALLVRRPGLLANRADELIVVQITCMWLDSGGVFLVARTQ